MCHAVVLSNNMLGFHNISPVSALKAAREVGSKEAYEFRVKGECISISYYNSEGKEVAHYSYAMSALQIFNEPREGDVWYKTSNGETIIKVERPKRNTEERKQIKKLRDLLVKHGVCEDCGEMYSHELIAPFAACACKTSEWSGLTSYMKQQRQISIIRGIAKELEESLESSKRLIKALLET